MLLTPEQRSERVDLESLTTTKVFGVRALT
jgi:hypothetical protein